MECCNCGEEIVGRKYKHKDDDEYIICSECFGENDDD